MGMEHGRMGDSMHGSMAYINRAVHDDHVGEAHPWGTNSWDSDCGALLAVVALPFCLFVFFFYRNKSSRLRHR